MVALAQRMADAQAAGWADWVRCEADERAVFDGCVFDIHAAERVRTFFHKFLRHSKGQWAGQPFALLDWQWQHIVGPLFGWKRADGTRRFRRGYIEVPGRNPPRTFSLLAIRRKSKSQLDLLISSPFRSPERKEPSSNFLAVG